MVTHIYTSNQTTRIDIDSSNDTWIIAKGVLLETDGTGMFEDAQFSNSRIVVNGTIKAPDSGIVSFGASSRIEIGTSAGVAAHEGVDILGSSYRLINKGDIHGTSFSALGLIGNLGAKGTISNSGSIHGGGIGIEFSHSDATITNLKGGLVSGHDFGVHSTGEATSHLRFMNSGILRSNDIAFSGESGHEVLVNRGKVIGDVMLGDGKDLIDLRGGSVTGHVSGEGDNDTYFVDSATAPIFERSEEGADTVRSTVSYALKSNFENLLLLGHGDTRAKGNLLANTITGNGGDNVISGQAGNDILTGGSGADVFIFGTTFGHDTITDFKHGVDRVNLSNLFAVDSFSDLMSHHLTQSGDDVLITAGADVLTLEHVNRHSLNAHDFIIG